MSIKVHDKKSLISISFYTIRNQIDEVLKSVAYINIWYRLGKFKMTIMDYANDIVTLVHEVILNFHIRIWKKIKTHEVEEY